ncbi:sirohydrochlorin chelatase [Halobacillus litoralis]|uniref:sirohydrochlorin chelatase n=1 Tax=Halobacillus litoralis TaxID=45668 RepID=UPI001CD2A36E|nr:sirohydrochlorin chelatase [Halobacillus litoralis]MCA1023317.1 sirohydrochlorin chelatase [Halobacillus litoralis]
MKAVLYVSHGSRRKAATRQAEDFLHRAAGAHDRPYEICYLELAHPDITEGMRRLVEKGADAVVVQPVLLLSAGHYYKDIPEELDRISGSYPELTISYGEPLGVQENIIKALAERIQETNPPIGKETNILLVGRGSHHPDTPAAVEKIAGRLGEEMSGTSVDVCYLAALSPRFSEAFQRSVEAYEHTIVVPYLWFTGVLMEEIQAVVHQAVQRGYSAAAAHHLQDHPAMEQSLQFRVNEALNKLSRVE